MNIIHIKTANGHMNINTETFFPCTQKKFRKLLKVINEFSYMNNVQEISEQIKQRLTYQIRVSEQYPAFARYTASGARIEREIKMLKKNLELLGQL